MIFRNFLMNKLEKEGIIMARANCSSLAEVAISTKTPYQNQFIYPCPFYRGIRVGEDMCVSQSSVLRKNIQNCYSVECESPWRVCPACIVQGELRNGDENSRNFRIHSVDPKTGYCSFHKKNGPMKRR